MYKVGLTSNFGTGLEDIVDKYKEMGIPVFDADIIIKFLLFNDSNVITKIKNEYGKVVFKDNKINLDYFNDAYKLKKLFNFIEIDILSIYERWRMANINFTFTVFKCSILFETGLYESMNYNINVFRPNTLRITEIGKKYDIKYLEAYELADNEMDHFDKNNMSDYVIHNYDTYSESVSKQIQFINRSIMK